MIARDLITPAPAPASTGFMADRAACGHFAAWDEEGRAVARSCECPGPVRPIRRDAAAARRSRLSPCPKCAAPRYGTGPHAPHLVEMVGRQVLVDCSGKAAGRG